MARTKELRRARPKRSVMLAGFVFAGITSGLALPYGREPDSKWELSMLLDEARDHALKGNFGSA